MKKIINMFMKVSCGSMGAILLFIASTATQSMSWLNAYEYKMPTKLLPKDD